MIHLYISFVFDVIRLYLQLIYCYATEAYRLVRWPKPKSIKHETILVTGGSNGIGKAILLYLASLEKNLTLVSWDVDTAANESVVRELRALGVAKALCYTVDVSDPAKVALTAAKVRNDVGDVTMLFNNAGICGPLGPCWKMDVSQVKKTLDVNLLASFITVKEFLPAMIQRNKGHIIATCSMAALVCTGFSAPYSASKHGLKAFSNDLREDLRKIGPNLNIFISTVFPAFINTNMIANHNTYPRKYRFLRPEISPKTAAEQLVAGVLRNQEDIYIPSTVRWSSIVVSLIPSEGLRRIKDLYDIEPYPEKHR